MPHEISRQSDTYAAFQPQTKPERPTAIAQSAVSTFLRGRAITPGLNQRHAQDFGGIPSTIPDPGDQLDVEGKKWDALESMYDAQAEGHGVEQQKLQNAAPPPPPPQMVAPPPQGMPQQGIPQQRVMAINTRGMDPEEHAYATEAPYGPGGEWRGDETGYPAPRREWNPYSGYEPTEEDERRREAVGEDDLSGYNWGPAPHYDPGAEPGPHPDFSGGQPLPFDTPIYKPGGGYEDFEQGLSNWEDQDGHLGSVRTAQGDMFTPNFYSPAQAFNPTSLMYGGGSALPPYTFMPGHQVGVPDGDSMLWDDGQPMSEAPGDIIPL